MIALQRVVLGALLLHEAAAAADAPPAPTKLALASVLTNDAVLPAAGASIWGWAVPGAKVEVAVSGAHSGSYAATASPTAGAWEVSLADVAPSLSQSNITVSSGADTLTLENVLFGELILCGGQVSPADPLLELQRFAL